MQRTCDRRTRWLAARLRVADAMRIDDVLTNSLRRPVAADEDLYWCWLMRHDPGMHAPMHAPGGIAVGRAVTGCEGEHRFDTPTEEDSNVANCPTCLERPQQVFYHPRETDLVRAHGVCCQCLRRMVQTIPLRTAVLAERYGPEGDRQPLPVVPGEDR